MVETEPYEGLSHAVVAWVRENIGICDVIHAHEWGGLFLDLATLDNYRQLKPGWRQCLKLPFAKRLPLKENGVMQLCCAVGPMVHSCRVEAGHRSARRPLLEHAGAGAAAAGHHQPAHRPWGADDAGAGVRADLPDPLHDGLPGAARLAAATRKVIPQHFTKSLPDTQYPP